MRQIVSWQVMAACVLLAGCTPQAPAPVEEEVDSVNPSVSAHGQRLVDESAVALVRVTFMGEIYLNGQKSSLEELDEAFSELKQRDGIVYYCRDQPHLDPPRAAMEVMAAIFDAGLPVRRVAEPDFSDAVDPEEWKLPDESQKEGENDAPDEGPLPEEDEAPDGDQPGREAGPSDSESAQDGDELPDESQPPAPAQPPSGGELPAEGREPGEEQTSDEPT